MPFGRRKVKNIRFDLRPIFKKHEINFIQKAAACVDPDFNKIYLDNGEEMEYAYLVVATGVKMNFDIVKGLRPEDNKIQNIVIPKLAKKHWKLLKNWSNITAR
ncbi:MAG: hypothetical protein AAF149_24020 [Bacteroidota bacterium]